MKKLTAFIILAAGMQAACSKAEDALGMLAPLAGDNLNPRVVASVPAASQIGVAPAQIVQLYFNKTMHSQRCIGAFSISPTVVGYTSVVDQVLTFAPNSVFSTGTYSMTLTRDCEDEEGRDLETTFNASFYVGAPLAVAPRVTAVGLQSQGSCTGAGSTGSSSGADWTSSSCFWDENLTMLNPTSYRFRGGDDGSGTATACADVNTDNFRIIFNNYMQTGVTINAISLSRLSPPTTFIRLSSYSWSDCQTASPYGCRVVTLQYAEQESTCNGVGAFGTAVGDFNLGVTAGSPAGFPLYMIQVSTSALDVNGRSPASSFAFVVEGD